MNHLAKAEPLRSQLCEKKITVLPAHMVGEKCRIQPTIGLLVCVLFSAKNVVEMCATVPKNVRYGVKNVRHGAENLRHGAKNVRHGDTKCAAWCQKCAPWCQKCASWCQSSPVQPVSDFRGGPLSVTESK